MYNCGLINQPKTTCEEAEAEPAVETNANDFCHIFTSRTVEQSETWFKPSGYLATSLTINILINVSNLSKLLKHC